MLIKINDSWIDPKEVLWIGISDKKQLMIEFKNKGQINYIMPFDDMSTKLDYFANLINKALK